MNKEIKYEDLNLKIPIEQKDYDECSTYIVNSINEIMKDSIKEGKNKIVINTNLKKGLPMENINKVAGPFVESWAQEQFQDVLDDGKNKYKLINVENCERLNMADVVLQFKRENKTDLPPKKWTQRRVGFSINASSKHGGVQWMGRTEKRSDLTGILRSQQSGWSQRAVIRPQRWPGALGSILTSFITGSGSSVIMETRPFPVRGI